jgi:CheY-like chemotaxis protein
MANILIIDDDKIRNERIKERLATGSNLNLKCVYSLTQAQLELQKKKFTAIILDMSLPTYDDSESTDPNAGIKLLEKISRGRFKTPSRIIGITALSENLELKTKKFSSLGFILYHAERHDYSWIDDAIEQIKYSISAEENIEDDRDLAILTVHGINTFGDWQERFSHLASEKGFKFDHLPFKFARFDFIKFLTPKLRKSVINKFETDFKVWQENNSCKRIVCIAHSFGTYILINTLRKLGEEYTKNIDTIILSGSVLKEDYDIYNFAQKNKIRVINECAIHDIPLLASKAFVLDTGMAGKIGFRGLSNENIVNRFYTGGHSVFFDKKSKIMEEKWIPILESNSNLKKEVFEYKYDFKHMIAEKIAKASGKFKRLYYIVIPILILLYIFT